MKLKYNSLIAKLYRWFYTTEVMPNNICGYSFKLVYAIIFSIPLVLMQIPYMFLGNIFTNQEKAHSARIAISIVILYWIFNVFAALTVFYLFYDLPEKGSDLETCIQYGMFVWGMVIAVFLAYAFDKYDFGKIFKKNQNIDETVESEYKKPCSKIDWE